ncbi:hypothetical protein [Ramlibacter humi]|uniref:Uncharacterized protein n=1 Tax=Ramlibacter humi TaxID=2530451 RepID=A0A4Z0BBY1_9BURK|nr:hypothetical protein [Ramlibacter humi]TFY96705.1 hypothetical protein EZ216_20195 [Ramlibacter humi]
MRTAFLLMLVAAAAQAQTPPEAATQRGGTYIEPPARVDPAFVPDGPNQRAASGSLLQLRLTLDIPLRTGTRAGNGTQGGFGGSPTLQAWLRWQPLEDRRWFAQLGLFKYLRAGREQPWNPDFAYSFGFEDARPGGWAFIYANWTGTRFSPGVGEHRFNFPQGELTARYHFELPQALQPALLVGDGDSALCQAETNLVPRYTQASGGTGSGKVSLGLGCRYTRPEGWFAHATAFAWPNASRQQPWDPDFVYGVGWAQGPWTVQYANYSGNRWPGRKRATGEGRLDSGSLSITWAAAW